jgi:predicted RNA-binding Zn ribbon-like protein
MLGPAAAQMLRDAAAVLERLRVGRVPLAQPIDDLTRLASEHAFVLAFGIDERGVPEATFRPTRDDAESSECAGLLSDLMMLFNKTEALNLVKRLKPCLACGRWVVDRSVSNRRAHCGETCSERLKKRRHREQKRKPPSRPIRRRS